MARIELKDLVKKFGKITAVAGINLEIHDGEFLILVGPSGCGKTTTLNMISGLEPPTSGEILIDGTVVNELDPGQRGLGMVFQDLALFPHMTVFENIAFGLKVKQVPGKDILKRVEDAAEAMHITKLLNKKPAECSGGEAQRVALARTIITNPSVFLMDEPLSSLDAKLRVDMRTELKQLHEQMKATFIYVTHDQAEAMTMADRIIVMRDGHIQQSGGPLDIYAKPVNRFVAGFFGTPTMNFIPGTVEGMKGDLLFRSQNLEQLLPRETDLKNGEKAVILGIRSEHVIIGAGENQGNVTITQPLGDSTLVFFEYGGNTSLVSQVNPDQVFSPGDTVEFGFDSAGFHVFDQESGNRLN